MFGSHSDDDDDRSARNKAITVNRKTNIHYAIHRQGEKCVVNEWNDRVEAS